jgi:hypothetical protein
LTLGSGGTLSSGSTITSGGSLVAAAASNMIWSGRSSWSSPADGEADVKNNAGTANAAVRSRVHVEANVGAKSAAATESNELYTNTGDGDGSSIALPDDPTAGLRYQIAVTAAQTITITAAAGESLNFEGDTCAASITSSTVGSALTVTAVTGGSGAVWMVTGFTGTWACND